MGQAAKPTRHNRTLTIDFHDETTYAELLGNTKAFVEFVLAFLLALGFQLLHKASCSEGGSLTRHSHYARLRLGGPPSGVSSARRAKPCSPSCRISSCVTARCAQRWPVMPCWRRMAG